MPLGFTLIAAALTSQTAVTVSNGPQLAQRNVSYVSNRAPLAPTPFIKLPVGAIRPRGWLLEYFKRQRDGLTGNLGQISAWLEKKDNAWLSLDGKGKWGWEEVPYWLKGFGDLGYILEDRRMIAEAKVWLNGVLSSQREDGDFGPTAVDDKGVEDFWPKMLMLYCLQSYHERTHDPRILGFMTRFFRFQANYPEAKFMRQYWQSRRTGDNLHSVLWLYNQTGDSFLLELARKIHRSGVDWKPRDLAASDWFKTLPDWHNVNVAQGFREPAEFYQVSKDLTDRRGSYAAFFAIRRYFGQVPGGMYGGDENSRPGYSDPRQGIETCGMVEQMNSDEELLRITGDPFWADHAENVAFNSYPAAVMPDFRSLRYITSPNMVLNDDKNHHPGIANDGPFLMMNPFSSRCCQHNHAQGWPYFCENLWQATSDNGLAAVLLAASDAEVKVANGRSARVSLATNYPFDDRLEFAINPAQPTKFPFYIRIPSWCADAELSVNGKRFGISKCEGKYAKIERTWRGGDRVSLKLPMAISITRWQANHNSASVDFGPLTFSLKIGEQYVKKGSIETAISDSKWQNGADTSKWPSYEIHPTTPWNYGLLLDRGFELKRRPWPKSNFPFTLGENPLSIVAHARRLPEWTLDQYGLCGTLMQSPVSSTEPNETVELVPMGAARLRISAFPVIRTK